VPVKTLSGNPCAEIVSNAVYAEGVAAWVDFAVDSSGTVKANLGRTAAVVDIGGRTTDCVTVLPGWKVDHGRSGTQNVGVLNLYEAVENRIRARFGVPDVPMELIEVAVRTGMVSLWGRDEDVSEIIASSKKEVFDQILREVYRRIGRGHDMEKVLFVGGGAVVFDGLQRSFPNAHTPENPEFANARGLLKCMQFGG
jgi:plasmid segregation protein ParM